MPAHRQPALRPAYPVREPPLTLDDVDALLAYRSQPDVCRYVPFEPMTREIVLGRLAAHWANTELTDEGQALTLGLARIDERNTASAKVARRLGMRQEARLVHNEWFKGEWSTELDFAMLADEWTARRDA